MKMDDRTFFMGDENDWMAGGKFCPVIVLPLSLLLLLFCMKLCNEILNGKQEYKEVGGHTEIFSINDKYVDFCVVLFFVDIYLWLYSSIW